jgi:dTDP-4-dehydrorhamnose reductase
MRILLTGTSGQVGGALLPLLNPGGAVLAPQRDAFDLSRPDALPAALDALKPKLIVNPAAYTAVDQAEDERALAFRVNAEAPAEMARWAARNDVPMVHFSTDYVFDGSGNEPWREDSNARPLSIYGKSKLAGDQAVMGAGGAHLIIRTSWVYAAKGRNFLTTILRLAQERDELRVVADQFGAPTSARVIAETVSQVLGAAEADPLGVFGQSGGLLNVSCSGETSWHGFAEAILDGVRSRGMEPKARRVVRISTSDFPMKVKRPANSRLHLGKLNLRFKLAPMSWDQSLKRELDQLKSI